MSRRLKDIGDWGEDQACRFLVRHGFLIVERNFHTTTGEIDIVALKGGDYYFIEVKTRTLAALATDEAVTVGKKIKFQKAVRAYCYRRNLPEIGLICASLIVMVNRRQKTVALRFVAWN